MLVESAHYRGVINFKLRWDNKTTKKPLNLFKSSQESDDSSLENSSFSENSVET